jgi:hypothetical protein
MSQRALLVAVLLGGCITPQPPAEPDLAPRPAPKPAAAKPATPELPTMAEVELGGEATRPKGAKGELHAWVTDGECWREGTHAWGETKGVANDRFFSEVFVPQGSQLWICAALVDGKKPITVYGQHDRAPLLGKGAGEVVFMGLKIPLAKGKRVGAPPPQSHH